MWSKGLLGNATPQNLLDTVIFYNRLFFFCIEEWEGAPTAEKLTLSNTDNRTPRREALSSLYTQDISKNHPGGLKVCSIAPKAVVHHANSSNAQRYFMHIFQLYRQLCPKDAPSHAFYPKPSCFPTSICWYSKIPQGHSTLSLTVDHLCKLAGIKRYYTNHSLQAAINSRLYKCRVDEQLVMEHTGHRSHEGVRSYKRLISDEQRETLSNLLN